MAWELTATDGGEGGAGGQGWRNTETGEWANYAPPGSGDTGAAGWANPTDNPERQALGNLYDRIAAAPSVAGAIVATPTFQAPYYTLNVGGATRYAVPQFIEGFDVGNGGVIYRGRGVNAPGGDVYSVVTVNGSIARVPGLDGDLVNIFDTRPAVSILQNRKEDDSFGGFLMDTLGAFAQGPGRVIGTGLGVSAAAGWLAGEGAFALAGAGEPAAFNVAADYGPAYFQGGSAYTAPAFDPLADFGPSYFNATQPGPLMPPAIPEDPAQLRAWGLNETAPGTWAQPEIQLSTPSYLDQLARLASPLTDAATKILTGAATSALAGALTGSGGSGGSPSIRTNTRTPSAAQAGALDPGGLLVLLIIGAATVAAAAALAKAKK